MESTGAHFKQSVQASGESAEKQRIPNNAFRITVDTTLDFFKKWCIFLRPFVSLTDREIDLIASMLKQRWELSKSTSDPAVLDTLMMSNDIIDKVIAECGLNKQHYYVITNALRKKGVINKNKLYPKLIPNIRKGDDGMFRLMVLFDGVKDGV